MPNSKIHFSLSERKLYLRFLDMFFPIFSFYLISLLTDYQYFNFNNPQIFTWSISLSIYLLFFGEIFEMYNLKVASDIYLTLRSTILTVVFATLFYVFTPYYSPLLPQNRLQILYFFGVLLVAILCHRFIYIKFIFSPRFLKNILVIAEEEEIEKILACKQHQEINTIKCYVSNERIENDTLNFINVNDANIAFLVKEYAINEIVVASNNSKLITKSINNQLIAIFEKGLNIKSVDSFIEDETFRVSENKLTHNFYNYFTFSKSHQNNLYMAFHRILDIVIAIIGILTLVILVPVVLLGNLLGNRGKLIYTQLRVGKRGKVFKIIKFRSMVSNAEKDGAVWAQKNDMRVTKFGRLLRKSRIDEIPQFINVLKGEMSLIGPRPERPEFVKQLENEIPYYAMRHVIKPGLTGWAQVMHPYASTFQDQQDKLMYDLYYIKERNLLMDFKIIVKTISTVLFFRGN
ncbi:exopolysaccharide biosynthesis polyprenyl glycosylphosphotransferase [Lutibacter maritimus]|uniref:Exopolysaccharide biosynthesis polyprenyl glycosylphosphotransferase n=1 Tax=Lutibacter maritimus TaxID=593133 RepID=A0A1I6P5D9_9FLAO|nr:exopolysaccharide biosynthesis polyprenyl glycosylphosphotransferase [Lutibacter maritimus]SFS35298.1 exopolysaccharide biosynthesis polyprenyl glycosylphosphotransferase [Lutibacter maritimus]